MTSFAEVTTRFLTVLHHEDYRVSGLCTAAAEVLSIERAAISIDEQDAGLQAWCATDRTAATIEQVQAMLGEGPGVTAIDDSSPVLVPDLSVDNHRWPGFLSVLAGQNITGSMFALPLQLGVVQLGVLDLYCAEPGDLDRHTLAAGLHVADLVATLLLTGSPRGNRDTEGRIREVTPLRDLLLTDQPATEGVGSRFEWWWQAGASNRDIHQAAGMVIAQTGASARDAYALLRGYAYAEGLSLTEVAERVVARRLRFGPENR
ncbi:GAF and ANTAR domain-containing protein [Nocardia sp. NPDC050712]|uniref:GAF and ANTAR domain-containing protein n=1 Tax=Nocardia sp. NPDC050712 TaxID=3155518 RepID=UPI0033E27022